CCFKGALDVALLARSLDELRARHEALRTTLHRDGTRLVQRVADPTAHPLSADDVALRDLDAWIAAHANAPFDLARGPLLRMALARVGANEHHLVIVVHHAIFDAWSFEIFIDELARLYAGHP